MSRCGDAGVRLEQVEVHAGGRCILGPASLEVGLGELMVLVGPNGAGKTTLLEVAAGIRPAGPGGRVFWQGTPLTGIGRRERARRIGWLGQGEAVVWPVQVADLVALGCQHAGEAGARADRVDQAIETMELTRLRRRRCSELSQGELARVHLARVFAGNPSIIFCDEPVSHLDPRHQIAVMEHLTGWVRAEAGRVALVVVHDLTLAGRCGDRICVLADGVPVAVAPPGEVLVPGLLRRVFGVSGGQVPSPAGPVCWLERAPDEPQIPDRA